MRKTLLFIIVGVGTVLAATSVPANALIFPLNFSFSGTAPAGDSPWLTATFDDIGNNQVQLTLDASGLTGDEFVSEWYFNFDFAVSDDWWPPDVISGPSYVAGSGIGSDNYKADGESGMFDILLQFETADNSDERFTAGEAAVYKLELPLDTSPELVPDSFKFFNQTGNFYSAAHIQSIANSDPSKTSGWIAATESISAVPEPATILLLGTGLAGLLGIGRFRFKKN